MARPSGTYQTLAHTKHGNLCEIRKRLWLCVQGLQATQQRSGEVCPYAAPKGIWAVSGALAARRNEQPGRLQRLTNGHGEHMLPKRALRSQQQEKGDQCSGDVLRAAHAFQGAFCSALVPAQKLALHVSCLARRRRRFVCGWRNTRCQRGGS